MSDLYTCELKQGIFPVAVAQWALEVLLVQRLYSRGCTRTTGQIALNHQLVIVFFY